jgi:hypothetical protein
MQTVGARSTLADLALASSARCWPTSYKRSLFQVAASETPQGNSAACVYYQYKAIIVGASTNQTFVPPTKIPPRAPFGPSEVLTAGMFLEGMDFVLQKSAAVSKDTLLRFSTEFPIPVVDGAVIPSLPASTATASS